MPAPRANRAGAPAALRRSAPIAAAGWLGLAVLELAAAGGVALGVVALVTRWLGQRLGGLEPAPATRRPRPRSTPVLPTMPAMPGKPVLRVGRGAIVAASLGTGFLVVLLAAGAAEAWRFDRRPADFFQTLPAPQRIGAERLMGYHWVDEDSGIVQIPIERAMSLLAQRGLPARSQPEGQQYPDVGLGGPTDSNGGRPPAQAVTAPP